MAKRQLFAWMRSKLKEYVRETVEPAVEKKALDKAYEKAADLVRKTVRKKYPEEDMQIVEKYGLGDRDDDIRITYPNGVVQEFQFRDDDEIPYVASCRTMYLCDEKTAYAVDSWIEAKEAFDAEREKRCNSYFALIDGSKYVDDLTNVWPEAATVLPAGSVPIALGPEQLAAVKADMVERRVNTNY